jgi:hypothetical protein
VSDVQDSKSPPTTPVTIPPPFLPPEVQIQGEKKFLENPNLVKNIDVSDFQKAIVVDAHLLKLYRACQWKYHLFENLNIVEKQLKPAPAFGIAMHEGIAEFRLARREGKKFTEAYETGAQKLLVSYRQHMPPEMTAETLQDDPRGPRNAIRLYTGFCEFFEPLALEYLYVEVPFALHVGTIDIPVEITEHDLARITYRTEPREVIYVGIIDAVIKEYGHILVNDLKSTAWSINENWLNGFKMDQGLIGYTVATRELLGIETQRASVHAMWVKAEPKVRGKPLNEYFHNKAFHWDETQFSEWHQNILLTAAEIERKKLMGDWIMDFGQNCGAFGGCSYRPLCSAPPGIRNRIVEMDYARGVWSPLDDERMQKLES